MSKRVNVSIPDDAVSTLEAFDRLFPNRSEAILALMEEKLAERGLEVPYNECNTTTPEWLR